jgi:polyhydroxyalkanoate synthase
MMHAHNSQPFTMPQPGTYPDMMAETFAAGQMLYKTNLLGTINLFRAQEGKPALGWPSRGFSAFDVPWTEGTARLLRYRGNANSEAAPVLCVFSLVNRPYVMDLLPGRSVVESLQKAGREVWLLDWGTPDPSANALPLDHYSLGIIPRAMDFVRTHTGKAPHVVGYCMGGTLALISLAGGGQARSLTAMATPVDLHDEGLLSLWTRAPGFDPRSVVDTYGHAPPHLLQPAFKMLDPVGLSTKLVHIRDKVGDEAFMTFFLAMEQWLEDSVGFPGRAFIEWIQLYRDNALIQPHFMAGSRKLSLKSLTLPVMSLIAEGDYISPPRSSLAIEAALPKASHQVLKVAGGHIGLATGGGAHKRAWPAVGKFMDEVDRGMGMDASKSENSRGKRAVPGKRTAPESAVSREGGRERPPGKRP